MINILIVNYNTQLLTECCIKSVNKHTPDCHIYVFDNSDKEPFVNNFNNVTVIDNTKKQYIDFDEFMSRYPNNSKSPGSKAAKSGSAKHCYTVEVAMDVIGKNFILLDSDVIVKRDLTELYDENFIFVGDVAIQPLQKEIKRVLPFVCFINVEKCKELGVHYYDDNYMHGIWNTKHNINADRYDTGAGFYVHAHVYQHKTIKHEEYVFHYKGGSWEDKASRLAYKNGTPEEFVDAHRRFWDASYKKVIYTCISGAYDRLMEPKFVDEDYDYVCFTDQRFNSKVWNFRPIPKSLEGYSQVKKQRCIKLKPHLFLPEFDLSVWVDSNVEIRASVDKYINDKCTAKNAFLFVGKHPQRDCIYEEGEACVKYKKETRENVDKQMGRYREEGMPEHFGLAQTCIVIRKHNKKKAIDFGEKWFEELEANSHRDQLCFTYVIWKNNVKGIEYLNPTIFNCETFLWRAGHIPNTASKTMSVVHAAKEIPATVVRKPNNLVLRVREIMQEKQKKGFNTIMS